MIDIRVDPTAVDTFSAAFGNPLVDVMDCQHESPLLRTESTDGVARAIASSCGLTSVSLALGVLLAELLLILNSVFALIGCGLIRMINDPFPSARIVARFAVWVKTIATGSVFREPVQRHHLTATGAVFHTQSITDKPAAPPLSAEMPTETLLECRRTEDGYLWVNTEPLRWVRVVPIDDVAAARAQALSESRRTVEDLQDALKAVRDHLPKATHDIINTIILNAILRSQRLVWAQQPQPAARQEGEHHE